MVDKQSMVPFCFMHMLKHWMQFDISFNIWNHLDLYILLQRRFVQQREIVQYSSIIVDYKSIYHISNNDIYIFESIQSL